MADQSERQVSDEILARFEELAALMRAITAGRRQTPAEDLLRAARDER